MYNLQEYRAKMEIAKLKQKLAITQQGLDILKDETMEYIRADRDLTQAENDKIEKGFNDLNDFIQEY